MSIKSVLFKLFADKLSTNIGEVKILCDRTIEYLTQIRIHL